MAIWAITGGIACGKSAVIAAFERRGVTCYSADKDARDVLKDPIVDQAVRDAFPDALDATGQLDRAILGQLIYADSSRRTLLGQIMHPAIRARMKTRIEQNQRYEPIELELYEVPLLFEGGLEAWFDGTICVTCSPDIQRHRLIERHRDRYNTTLTGEEVDQILASQLPVAVKAERADIVIDNSGSTDDLESKVESVMETLISKARP
jgi:dephospho-CoA kinase